MGDSLSINSQNKILNGNALKLIAIIAMTIDHLAWLLFPGYPTEPLPIIMHVVGRLTCPIMCFFIAEGFHYTRDVKKYSLRLLLFSLVSHFAYVFASNDFVDLLSFVPFYYGSGINRFLNKTSVMFSLWGGLTLLRINSSKTLKPWAKTLLTLLVCLLTFPCDWSCIAALCVLAIGSNRGDVKKQILWCFLFVSSYVVVYVFSINVLYGFIQLCVVLAVPLLLLYNGKRGKNEKVNKFMKWFFYIYYPLHLFIIGLVKLLS